MTRTVPNDILIPNIAELLAEGMEVTLRAKGRSMHPYIRNEKDSLVFKKVDNSKLKVGDIVLAKVSLGYYVVHRVIQIEGDKMTLMGDGNIYGTEECLRQDVYGKLMFIERRGKRIDCNTPWQMRKAWLLRTCYRAFYKTGHKIKHLI